MDKISRTELFALFPKVRAAMQHRLDQDYVDGMVVFERVSTPGHKTVCVYGSPYTIKNWQDAEGCSMFVGTPREMVAVAYYEKPHDRDEIFASAAE